jgi:hypothetical protein
VPANEEERRRGADHVTMEIHGMVQRLDQKMDDTHHWIKMISEKVDTQDDRMKPLEEFHGTAKTLGKVVAWVVATPALLAGVWAGVKVFLIGNHTP